MYQLNSQLIEEYLQPLAGHIGLGTTFIESVLQSQQALTQQVVDQQQQLHKQLIKERDIYQVGEISKNCAAQVTQSWLACYGQLFQAVQDYGSASTGLYQQQQEIPPAIAGVASVSVSKNLSPLSAAADTPKKTRAASTAKKRVPKPAVAKQVAAKDVVDNPPVQRSAAAKPKSAVKATPSKVKAKASEQAAVQASANKSTTAVKSPVSSKVKSKAADKTPAPAAAVNGAPQVTTSKK